MCPTCLSMRFNFWRFVSALSGVPVRRQLDALHIGHVDVVRVADLRVVQHPTIVETEYGVAWSASKGMMAGWGQQRPDKRYPILLPSLLNDLDFHPDKFVVPNCQSVE